jgi:hypothetical protein
MDVFGGFRKPPKTSAFSESSRRQGLSSACLLLSISGESFLRMLSRAWECARKHRPFPEPSRRYGLSTVYLLLPERGFLWLFSRAWECARKHRPFPEPSRRHGLSTVYSLLFISGESFLWMFLAFPRTLAATGAVYCLLSTSFTATSAGSSRDHRLSGRCGWGEGSDRW